MGLLSGSCNYLCALGDVTTGGKGRQATQKSIIQFQSPKKGHRFSIGSAGHDEAIANKGAAFQDQTPYSFKQEALGYKYRDFISGLRQVRSFSTPFPGKETYSLLSKAY